MHSYCFERNVSLSEAKNTLSVLLLPRDIVEMRPADNCIDVVAPPDRVKLFEKFLSKRYDLLPDSKGSTYEIKTCRLDFKTTKKSSLDSKEVSIGNRTAVKKNEVDEVSSSTMEILLTENQPGELELSPASLKVVCKLVNSDTANMTFSFYEKDKASLKSEVLMKKGEWINIGSVLQDLNSQAKTLGIPQTSVTDSTGKSETKYEIQFK